MNSPIMLSTSVTVPDAATRESEQTALTNPFRTAMLIDEIRLKLDIEGSAYSNTNLFRPRIQFHLGRMPLCNTFIPCLALTKFLCGGIPYLGQTVDRSFLFIDWKLPQPLYIPPTEYLIPRVYNAPISGATPLSVTVAIQYVGRSLPSDYERPQKMYIPWLANYTSPVTAYNVSAEETTTESDIVNPFNEPVYVQRFIGTTSDAYGANISPRGSLYTTTNAYDSFGNVLVRDRTPFSHLFTTMDKVWPAKSVLQPKGFYIFNTMRAFDGLPSDGNTEYQYSITMQSYREVVLR